MSYGERTQRLDAIMRLGPVIPVVTIETVAEAVPLARALVAGGLSVIEVTLRTPAALEALERIAHEVEGAIAGAGTVLGHHQAQEAVSAGAKFLVSPGATPALLAAAQDIVVPFLPGIATASEAMAALEHGLHRLKFFPAEAAGGVAMLKSLYGPFPQLAFCPTGGIDQTKAASYLALPNVLCVGGSWLTPAAAIREGAWSTITTLAKEAAGLR